MLEFIVLGQIPGTSFQITFAWFTASVLIGLFWLDLRIRRHPTTNKKQHSK